MKVLVTGATGFIGSAIVRHLLAGGYQVRILARTKRNQFLLDGLDVDIVPGSVTSPSAVNEAVKGCAIVMDVASVYAFYPFWEKQAKAMYRINVQGTKNMLSAALKNRVKKFVHTSTIATIGKNQEGHSSDELAPFDDWNASHYARSKYLAEQEVWEYCRKGLPATVLNPAIVIGPRDVKPTPSGEIIVKFLNQKYPGFFDTAWSVADVDDVARAHVAAIASGKAGERYILCNKRHPTMKGVFLSLEEISGVKAPRVKIPHFILSAFIYTEEWLAYKVFKRKPLLPTEGVKFCKNAVIYDNSKAVRDLGYTETPFKETLKKAVDWYWRHGYVEPKGLLRLKARGSRTLKTIMRFLKMDRYADRLGIDTVVFYLVIQTLHVIRKLGVRPHEDGWRKITQAYLYSEQSKFALTALRLDFWSDHPGGTGKTIEAAKAQVIRRLSRFLRDQPSVYWELRYRVFFVERAHTSCVDLVHAEFEPNGRLTTLVPHFDSKTDDAGADGIEEALQKRIIQRIIRTYNRTKDLPDIRRPKYLKRELYGWARKDLGSRGEPFIKEATRFIDRVLGAAFIHFEEVPSSGEELTPERFLPPLFIKRKHPGFGFLNILCRLDQGCHEADLWFQFSHIPADGVPMQEVLEVLKKQWGPAAPLKLPSFDGKVCGNGVPQLCSSRGGDGGTYHVSELIDFRPLLKYRKLLVARYGGKFKNTITVAALFMWELSHYPAFGNMKFAVPVDIAATNRRERSLGFVFIRPGIYFDKHKADGGLLHFQRDFDRLLRATRKRKSAGYQLLENYALAPSVMYRAALKVLPSAIQEFGGTIGITIIKNAEFFISPYTDVHTQGFIAISNFHMRAKDGRKVCHVSIKGPKHKINRYMEAIKEVTSLKA